jgi:hypothetical protein
MIPRQWLALALAAMLVACGGGGPTSEPSIGQWTPEEVLAEDASWGKVAIAANGAGAAVWSAWDPQQVGRLTGRLYRLGEGWTAATTLDPPYHVTTVSSGLVINASGQGIVGWSREDGAWVSTFTAAGFSAAQRLAPVEPGFGGNLPRVAIDSAGDGIALTGDHPAQVHRYSPRDGWQLADVAGTPPTFIRMDAAGTAYGIRFEALDDEGGWRTLLAILPKGATQWQQRTIPGPAGQVGALAYDVSPNGKVIVVRWIDGVHHAVLWDGTDWFGSTVLTSAAGAAVQAVDLVDSGAAIVLWAKQPVNGTVDASTGLWATRFLPSSGWGAAEPVARGPFYIRNAQVALDRHHNMLAAWEAMDLPGTSTPVWTAVAPAGGAWQAPLLLDAQGYEPSVGIGGFGTGHVLWTGWRMREGTPQPVIATRRYGFAGGD